MEDLLEKYGELLALSIFGGLILGVFQLLLQMTGG
jgi:hypothetical protein